MASNSSALERQESANNFCVICCHESDLFCLGPCEHPICFECGVRMRIICESKECPICRSEMKTMLVVKCEKRSSYSAYESGRRLTIDRYFNEKYGLKFENPDALNAVKDILAHVCTVCENEPEFRNFDELGQHMRRAHELFYCDLCVDNLKLFSWERKCYNREQLAKHRRLGDPDDRSHRGHPLCEFCDQRYIDEEHLYRHLRRDHYFCHYCDADGFNKFYASPDELKKHMKSDHFLCEEGQCKSEPLGISFRHEIDYKAHKANVHGAKQERIVNIDFGVRRGGGIMGDRERPFRDRDEHRPNRDRDQQDPRSSAGSNRGGGPRPTGPRPDQQRRRERPSARKPDEAESDDPELSRAVEASKNAENPFALKKEEFPSLNPKSSGPSVPKSAKSGTMANYVANAGGLSTKSGSLDENNFPSLPSTTRKAKQKKNAEGGGRVRRSSRSASPVKNQQSAANFVMVDDDVAFPSFSEQEKATETATAAAKAAELEKAKKAKEAELAKKQRQQTTPSWATSKGAQPSRPASSAWNTKEEAFPALVPSSSTGGKSKQNLKLNSSMASKPWAQLLLADEKPATPAKKETKKKKQGPSPSSMATDALLESLPPGLPIKSKARRVAQQKQRPSECSDDGFDDLVSLRSSSGAIMSSAPPPGFENVDARSVPPPPPGFEFRSTPLQEPVVNGIEHHVPAPSQYQYTKPSNFDARNRALFDRLRALMNNEDDKIQEFKKSSSEYRRGESDASTYCQRVRQLLDDDGAYVRIFPELVCLLPDIQRQNALWDAFRTDTSLTGGLGPNSGDIMKRCVKCAQLLVKLDYYEHAQHAHPMKGVGKGKGIFEEDYPSLG